MTRIQSKKADMIADKEEIKHQKKEQKNEFISLIRAKINRQNE